MASHVCGYFVAIQLSTSWVVMICFKCQKDIKQEDDKFMYGLDRPYINLYFHKNCWNSIKDNLEVYFTQNEDSVYNYIRKQQKTGKNVRK